ncbi:MAG TPA: tyrosine-type recombinase/integrase [Kiritimatiellia bacterium]|nr:tyrosine-type recombinase/integrase [Kiritimatiellia bacterium]
MARTASRRKPGRKPSWPRIRARGSAFLVDCGKIFGKRERRQFDTIEEAEIYAEAQRTRRASLREVERFEDTNRSVRLTTLTDSQRIDALQAFEVLGGKGSLLAAARFWLKHSAPTTGPRPLREVYEEYLASKTKSGCRPATLADVKARLGSFVLEHAREHVHAITTQDIEKWIDARKGQSIENRDGYRRAFVSFFNYAVKRAYREGNPASVIELPKRNGGYKRIAILTPDEATRLLRATLEHAPDMIPYFAIGIFAGLRPENELAHLDWRNIDFTHRTIHVEAASAKTRRERYVDMSPNLIEWLTPYRQHVGPIVFLRQKFDLIREKAELIPPREVKGYYELTRANGKKFRQKRLGARKGTKVWKADIMRHTFASYHLAEHNDAGKTASQLGHGSQLEMLFQHYRRAIRAEQAHQFWAIRPSSVSLPASAAT